MVESAEDGFTRITRNPNVGFHGRAYSKWGSAQKKCTCSTSGKPLCYALDQCYAFISFGLRLEQCCIVCVKDLAGIEKDEFRTSNEGTTICLPTVFCELLDSVTTLLLVVKPIYISPALMNFSEKAEVIRNFLTQRTRRLWSSPVYNTRLQLFPFSTGVVSENLQFYLKFLTTGWNVAEQHLSWSPSTTIFVNSSGHRN